MVRRRRRALKARKALQDPKDYPKDYWQAFPEAFPEAFPGAFPLPLKPGSLGLGVATEAESRALQRQLHWPQGAREVLAGLRGRVAEVALSEHGNHLLTAAVHRCPREATTFIAEELQRGALESLCTHRMACRVAVALLEHHEPATLAPLRAHLLRHFLACARHPYASFVLVAALEHEASEAFVDEAQTLVEVHLARFVSERHSWGVLAAALSVGSEAARLQLAAHLFPLDTQGDLGPCVKCGCVAAALDRLRCGVTLGLVVL